MVTDQLCRVSWRSRPGSFVSLMTLYESNYIRLGWLLPQPHALQGSHVSRVRGDVDLHLQVLERCRYTTTLGLSYRLENAAGPLLVPDMQLRVYHDARLAEAVQCAGWERGAVLKRLAQSLPAPHVELDQRWARNVLLNKWLEYCAERGHRFDPPA